MVSRNIVTSQHRVIEFLICFFTLMYVFCYQFNYPFTSTLFLYASFGSMIIYACLTRILKLERQFVVMFLLALVSFIGVLYTDNQERGQREAILLLVMLLYALILSQDIALSNKLRKYIYICSFLVMLGVLIQYAAPTPFNSFMQSFLRADCYEQLMWSFKVDGAYAGLSAYTPDAAYFSTLIFGFSIFRFLNISESRGKRGKLIALVLAFCAVFVVILTSKRGLIVAMIGALVLTVLIMKKSSPKTIVAFGFVLVVGIVLVYFLSDSNVAIQMFLQRFDVSDGHDLTTGRMAMWEKALETLGRGISLIGKGTGSTYTIWEAGMHNIYLQIYYDHGLLGLIVYLAFFIYNLQQAIRCKDEQSLYVQFVMLIYGISGNPIYSNSFFIVYITYTVLNYQESNEAEMREAVP